jgi:hypothetical protein
MKHDTDEQPVWSTGAGEEVDVAFVVPMSKRRAFLARHKGVRSLRAKLMR